MDVDLIYEHEVVVARTGKKVFHEKFCPYVHRINPKNRLFLDESQAVSQHYRECAFCRSSKGLAFKYRKLGMDAFYDAIDNAVCFRTEVGFWKAVWFDTSQAWRLFHLNAGEFSATASAKVLMRRSFHRQGDVPSTTSLGKIVHYIRRHDGDLILYSDDYHNLPKTTKQQKKFYNRAKKRAKKKSIRNVYKILDKIKMKDNRKEN